MEKKNITKIFDKNNRTRSAALLTLNNVVAKDPRDSSLTYSGALQIAVVSHGLIYT